ncbi:MAG TPA: isochorismatase family cysteine hydrolase [Terrimicrobiaceae bacterium]
MKSKERKGTSKNKQDALVLIDVINDFDFPQAEALLRFAMPAAKRIAALKDRAKRSKVPAIYANDNFGRWRSDFRQQIAHCLKTNRPGRDIVELLRPSDDDYFVLKPMHSGFFSTTLDVLLERLGVRRLILVGFAADICVLYTANDAYMRDFKVVVPSDCVASETKRQYRFALDHIAQRLKANIRPSEKVRFR